MSEGRLRFSYGKIRRLEFPGALQHLTSRGNVRPPIHWPGRFSRDAERGDGETGGEIPVDQLSSHGRPALHDRQQGHHSELG